MVFTPDTALLDAPADCLESGGTLVEALENVATAGRAAEQWAQHVRRSARSEVPVARALRESNVLDDEELSFLSAAPLAEGAGIDRIEAELNRASASR
jgi:hypothetical protein